MFHRFIKWRQERINAINRERLINTTPTLICSNCTGGILYHWLGLQFRSPFINLYMSNNDFLVAMENFDRFFATEIIEDTNAGKIYPVGIGYLGVRVHFMHYPDFETARAKWNERKQRIDKSNMAIFLTNLQPSVMRGGSDVIQRFNSLHFKNKLIFSGEKIDAPNIIYLKGYKKVQYKKNIYATQSIFGSRYIDQFDFVDYINRLKE